jgi:hypothetical protein
MPRYLTKSRFKLALDCPTKLFYTRKDIYPDTSQEDDFLKALAEGGFQVGELAKCYYPGGHDITEGGYEAPLQRTAELLKLENVVIFEAAILYENLFIRIDILEKKGNHLRLIEVKAKSISGDEDVAFLKSSGHMASGWSPYLYDVAFQNYVLSKAFPDYSIDSFLMLADKDKKATVNGLNQKFQLVKEGDRTRVKIIGDVSKVGLGAPVLREVKVNEYIELIFQGKDADHDDETYDFVKTIQEFAEHYEKDLKSETAIGTQCASCQFHTDQADKKSGFLECWKAQTSLTDGELKENLIFDLWNSRKKGDLIAEGIYKMKDVEEHHIGTIKTDDLGALTTTERQWLQVEKVKNKDDTVYLDLALFLIDSQDWQYPYHFIDFETSMVAIPFNKGRRPYEQTAFQFSHHIMQSDGAVAHKSQYLNTTKGAFPNYEFLRTLKETLENDQGTIFKYAAHENTVLNQIRDQLLQEVVEDVPDKEVLIAFIETITNRKKEGHIGPRDMVDMLQLVKRFHYDPLTKGSNSIKAVLPAVLNRSKDIQELYGKAIYGKGQEIPSLNFKEPVQWVQVDDHGNVKDPYKLLPPLFESVDVDLKADFITNESLAGGGAAMTAYAKMQFSDMTDLEKEHIQKGLYRYCELDTLAMVMIMQYWQIEAAKLR